jgi:hypothetical protein
MKYGSRAMWGGYPAQLSTCTERKVLIPFGTKRIKVEFADEGGDILFLQRYNTVVSNNSRTSEISLDIEYASPRIDGL